MNIDLIDLTPIFKAVIALIAALITYRLVPWIKSKTTESQQNYLRGLVKSFVFAAEQMYGAGNGAEKMSHVRMKLREAGYDVDTDEIEALVYEYLNKDKAVLIQDGYTLPALEDWPLEMIVQFCEDNEIPCQGAVTKVDYIRAITQGGRSDPPHFPAEEAVNIGYPKPDEDIQDDLK